MAIEPESGNFAMLKKNTGQYPNIKPIQAGLWSRKTYLRTQDSDVATWSFRVVESSSSDDIPALGVQDILHAIQCFPNRCPENRYRRL